MNPITRFDSGRLLLRGIDGQFDAETCRWVQRGFTTLADAEFEIPMDRCFLLPTSAEGKRKLLCQTWLLQLAKRCDRGKPWTTAGAVRAELQRFLQGPWPAWRHLKDPPAGSSAVHEVCFRVCKFMPHPESGISQRTLLRLIDNFGP